MPEITEKPKILLVDDEKNILNSLNRLFFDEEYDILLADSARKALEVISILEVNVIISDQRMPNMTGVEMLTKAQQLQPDAVRMILTGYTDIDAAIKAVNEGAVFRFLSKPWNDNELKMTVKQGVEHYRLQKKNRELFALNQKQNVELKTLNDTLNQRVKERTKTIIQKNQELSEANKQLSASFFKLINIVIEIVETKSSDLASHCKRVAASARYIAEEMELSEEEIEMIEIAAMLHDIGKISMSDQVLLKRDTMMNSEELSLWKRHPLVGERILGNIDRLNDVRLIIRHHHEFYNGHGFPDGLVGEEIPLGARIIAVADTYDKLVNKVYMNVDNTRIRAMKALRSKMGTELDPEIVARMVQFLQSRKSKSKDRKEVELKPFELKENMILSRDLYTTRGTKVFAKDKRLDIAAIKAVIDSDRMEKLLTSVFIYN